MNKIVLTGRLASEKFNERLTKKHPLIFVLAVKEYKNNRTDFIRVFCWDKIADNFIQYVKLGDLIEVEGKVQTSIYEKDGKVEYGMQIVAEKIVYSVKNKKDRMIEEALYEKEMNKLKEQEAEIQRIIETYNIEM
ncbi:single-stranded DNA-binding protein [Mycoplasmopsis gallinarum]|uniref:single-stranded DNA-binding protein n=1 Tax=Mycoplasmopsis gallinarum TaxID=29557 RepID=UPI000562D50D|nr:single-stranded DNA-binding protein [Mycoplasmopsis gallinarum]